MAEILLVALVRDPVVRAAGALVVTAVIAWSAMRLGALRLMGLVAAGPTQQRRFLRLRRRVEELLETIRRLNWLSVIGERGFQNQAAAQEERAVIEQRLRALVDEIGDAAGDAAGPRTAKNAGDT